MRKVCYGMSKQRCLLIIFLFVIVLPVFGGQGAYIKTTVLGIISEPSGWLMQNRAGWEGTIARDLTLQVDSDLRWSDLYLRDNPQKAWHSGTAALQWQHGDLALKAAYRNTIYGSSQQAQLYPRWQPLTEYQRSLQHQIAVAADWSGIIDIYAMQKNLQVTPYTFDFDTFQFTEGEGQGLNDLYAGIGAAWQATDNIKLSLGADYKDGTFASEDTYQITSVNARAEAQYPLAYGSRINGSLTVEHREGDFLDSQRANVLHTRVRVQKRVINDLSAMLVWENKSCFDNGFGALRLLSNYLRLQAVFNLGYDTSATSFVLAGGKYSPENDASAVFAETECLLAYHTYASAGAQWIPDRQSVVKVALIHRFMRDQDIRLVYNRVNNLESSQHTDYLGVATGFWW